MNARPLWVLIIDDDPMDPDSFGTNALSLLALPSYGESDDEPQLHALSAWGQHLWLWYADAFPAHEPDLVLIDCRFSEDKLAPSLDGIAGFERDDPRGLLHGALYLARMFGRDRLHPFGFAIYSQDASSVADDPYAQTFFGFLIAMRESTRTPRSGEREAPDLSGAPMASLPQAMARQLLYGVRQGGLPSSAWRPALLMYRERLAEAFEAGAYLPKQHSIEAVNDALMREDDAAFDAGLGLTWSRPQGDDCVQLRSLFADYLDADRWGPAARDAAREWLASLANTSDLTADAIGWADAANRPGAVPSRIDKRQLPGSPGVSLTNFYHACAVAFAWLRDRCENGRTRAKPLAERVGLELNQVNRYFQKVHAKTWSQVVVELDRGWEQCFWPLPSDWRLERALRDWATWRKINYPFSPAQAGGE